MVDESNSGISNEDEAEECPRRVKLFFSGDAETPAERMAAIRQLRKGQILNLLLRGGPASRVDISRTLGFNLRTVSLLVSSLIDENLIIEKPAAVSATMGRRPVPLELNAMAASVMAIDVRRQKTVMALMDLNGRTLARAERDSDFGDLPEDQARWLVEACQDFLDTYKRDVPPLAGAGLSIEGFVFKQHVAHRHAAVTEPIRLALKEGINAPVCSDTDSRLVAIAEQWFGGARGDRDSVILNISDGLGAGFIVDGKILSGSAGLAGEIGHIPLGDPGVPCYCGASGCLENIVSGSGLARLATQHGLSGDSGTSSLPALLQRVFENPKGRVISDKFVRHLGLAVIITENLFNPGSVVLGGSVAPLIAPFHSQILDTLDKTAVPFIMDKTRVTFSTLGEDAVLLGAAGLILNHIYSASHVAAESLL